MCWAPQKKEINKEREREREHGQHVRQHVQHDLTQHQTDSFCEASDIDRAARAHPHHAHAVHAPQRVCAVVLLVGNWVTITGLAQKCKCVVTTLQDIFFFVSLAFQKSTRCARSARRSQQ